MGGNDKLTLAEARKRDKLDQFIKEREADAEGDRAALSRGIEAMARRSSEAPKASRKAPRGG